MYLLSGIEKIAVLLLHVYLLHSVTLRCSRRYTTEEGFFFRKGFAYILFGSTVGALIVGIVQYLHLHVLIPSGNYTQWSTAALSECIVRNGLVPATKESMLSQMFDQIQNTTQPYFF